MSITAACFGAAFLVWFLGGRALVAEGLWPLERTATWFQKNVSSRVRTLWRRMGYGAEVQRLRRENDLLHIQLEEATRQLGEAHARANRPLPATGRWLAADVLSRGGTTGARDYLRVGRGSLNGVYAGAAVIGPEGLVGRVTDVSPHTCVVTLITDPALQVSCELETDDTQYGALYGILTGNGMRVGAAAECLVLYSPNPLCLKHLGRAVSLPPRTRVVTAGLGGVYPRGIPVGYLLEVPHEDNTALEREARVIPAVDFAALEYVFIRRDMP